MKFNSAFQIILSSLNIWICPIRKTECIENRISSSRFIALTSAILANGVCLIVGSMFITKSTGIKSLLAVARRMNFKETSRCLLVDKKLLNANNPPLFCFI